MNTEQKEKISVEVHNQIIGWTENCDTKASIVLAFIGVLVSIAFTSEYLLETIETQVSSIIIYWRDGIGTFCITSTMMFVSLLGFITFIGLGCYYSIKSLRANIECPNDSIIFFGKIADLSQEEYIEKIKKITEDDFEQDKLSQIHICAKICEKKFENYKKSIVHLSIGLLFFVCFILFVIILKAL